MSKFLWMIIPLVLIALMAWCLYAHILRVVGRTRIRRKRVVSVVLTVLLMLPAVRLWSAFYWLILLLHFSVFCVLFDLLYRVVRRFRRKESRVWDALHTYSVLPLLCTVAVALYGFANIHDIRETTYTVTTAKTIRAEGYRIGLVSDVHYGLLDNHDAIQTLADTLSGKGLDMLVIAGDLTDEGSSLEDVREICRILGGVKTNFGVYYVFGNHDTARYSAHANFSKDDLAAALRDNGITILEDDTVAVNGELLLAGRQDRSYPRMAVADFLKGADSTRYLIVADHQPYELEAKASAGVDLQLSGHTHSGQVFPVGYICRVFHIGDLNYGHARFGGMDAIVTSGVTGWGAPFRTQNHSEYVIINVHPQAERH